MKTVGSILIVLGSILMVRLLVRFLSESPIEALAPIGFLVLVAGVLIVQSPAIPGRKILTKGCDKPKPLVKIDAEDDNDS